MTDQQIAKIQEQADRLARIFDDAIGIPGTNIRFGWDAILGLVPGLGDVVTLAPQLYLVAQALRANVRKRVYAKMLLNVLIDFLVGAIPVVGDIVDIFWKSNRKNAELLRNEIARCTVTGKAR